MLKHKTKDDKEGGGGGEEDNEEGDEEGVAGEGPRQEGEEGRKVRRGETGREKRIKGYEK